MTLPKTALLIFSAAALISTAQANARQTWAAKRLERKIGIPVESDSRDHCTKAQLRSLIREYRKSDKSEKLALQNKFRAYSSLKTLPLAKVQTITGERAVLRLEHCYHSGRSGTHCSILDSKTIADHRERHGSMPVTSVTKGSVLEIAPQAGDDLSQIKIYTTRSQRAFVAIQAEYDVAFNAAMMGGALGVYMYQNAETYCADKVKVHELF